MRVCCVLSAAVCHSPKTSTALFFKHNTSLGPPYQILIDTNFINFSITNKLDIFKSMMDCLLAKCIPIITGSVNGSQINTSMRGH
jgi:U3 small nucleolar RNA-associated protein 24